MFVGGSGSGYDRGDMPEITLRTRTILLFGLIQVIVLTVVLVFFLKLD